MKVNDILKNCKVTATRACGKIVLKAKSYAPEILLTVGGVAAIATVVVACKETLQLEEVIDEHKEAMDKLNEAYEGKEDSKEAKKAKDFAKADAIREELLAKGIVIKDTREGVVWHRA